MKRQTLLLLLVSLFLLVPNVVLSHEKDIGIVIDGEQVASDATPLLKDNRVLVPVRIISENLGYGVSWNSIDKKVGISNGLTSISFQVGDSSMWKNGTKIYLDVPPIIDHNRTYLPIRAISENLGAIVTWDNSNKSVIIQSKALKSDSSQGETSGKLLSVVAKNETSITLNMENNNTEPYLFELDNPHRLVIDMENTLLADDVGVSVPESNNLIDQVRVSQYDKDPDKVRVVLDLKKDAKYYYYFGKDSVNINLVPYTATVVIDAGHGGKDPGAYGVTGHWEKNVNLAVALKVNKLLQNDPDIKVVLTRNKDVFIPLDGRVQVANDLDADLFVSIHANALPSSQSAHGIETYYTRWESREFARILHNNVIAATGSTNRGLRTAGYRVIKYTTMPAALLEMGYLTNYYEEKRLFTSSFQDEVAQAVVKSIKEYLKLQ